MPNTCYVGPRDSQIQQQLDEEQRQHTILTALHKVYNAGLEDEALLLAFESGATILKAFEKEIADA